MWCYVVLCVTPTHCNRREEKGANARQGTNVDVDGQEVHEEMERRERRYQQAEPNDET